MPLAFIILAISSSDVRNMFPRTAWICSRIAFACGFLTLVSLHYIPYVLHRDQKWSLNSLPLSESYVMYWQRGYLLNQFLYTRLLIWAELLSKQGPATLVFVENVTFLPLPMGGTVIFWATVGTSTILSQLVVGLIMVRHMKSILEPSLPLRV